MKRFQFLKPLFFLSVIFASFHLLYDVIYENHLGEVTDSDVLYPYLFARDFWTGGFAGIRGWNLPPCTYLFPEIVLAILLFPVIPSVYGFHLVFGFFSFVLPFFLARQLGMPKRYAYSISLGFFVLAGLHPNSFGQFYLPGFHAMVFFFAIGTLYELEHWNPKKGKVWFRFLILMTLVWVSEYWFFVQFVPYLFLYAIIRMGWKSFGPTFICLVGFYLAKAVAKVLRLMGIGTIGTDNVYLLSQLKGIGHLLVSDPNSLWKGIVQSFENQDLFSQWIDWYLVIGVLFVILFVFRNNRKDFFLEFVFYLSPFITLVFLYTIQVEPNIRYLYFLPFGILYFSFRILERIPFLRWIFPIVLVIGCFWYYLGKHTELVSLVKAGETKRNHRMECLSQFDPNLPGAATYWPIKYSYTFSDQNWNLVPFTKDGVYYPWIANSSWDKDFKNQTFDSFGWGVTESKENLADWKDVRLVKECEGWYFFQRN
ncbi:hypothetical protein EHQ46_01350 [Leptospira yanagawae]|uniref:Glycosyltransferase RgtA/B/C/D-like domain-containing protein n=1 Tax=Leptospira yanagawae TaxID=293069 RepID=A0ABY2M6S5_9LEPT|nr:hypothetical protein [Leptospira yanagawae]TGL23803.1 hypothetical protein EHQ46_01350 [Leptospira yanagawae]